ncbi:MAG: hypothetical protein M5T61_17215 [Acidimicrobiia bacterium]|nr:hypothetical protein [Acidimicrobiia bacterium]
MTNATPDDHVLDFVDRYLAYLTGAHDEPDIGLLDESQRAAALRQLRALELLDEPEPYPMPPIEEDPVAKRFGFDRTEPTITISTAALREAASSAGVPFSELAQRLTTGGRPTRPAELLRLTNTPTVNVERDLAARFAAILRTTVGALEAAGSGRATPTLDDYLALEEAQTLIEELAAELGISFETIEGRSRELVGAAAFRNYTNDAWREALVRALEQIRDEQRR